MRSTASRELFDEKPQEKEKERAEKKIPALSGIQTHVILIMRLVLYRCATNFALREASMITTSQNLKYPAQILTSKKRYLRLLN